MEALSIWGDSNSLARMLFLGSGVVFSSLSRLGMIEKMASSPLETKERSIRRAKHTINNIISFPCKLCKATREFILRQMHKNGSIVSKVGYQL